MDPKIWTIKGLLKVSADYLQEKQIESPRLTAEVLLAHQLHTNRMGLYLNLEQPLNESEVAGYRDLIRRRIQREPLQYITGFQEFWSLDFMVDSRVLIPRPETELIVEQALKQAKNPAFQTVQPMRILDMGTGSGVLAVVLAREIPNAAVWATDISPNALALARINAERHGVLDRIEFMEGDLWDPFKNQLISFDLIVSNPPYVMQEEYDDLPLEVRDYEPRIALDGGARGMNYLSTIIEKSPNFINPGGWLMLEMAAWQTDAAVQLIDRIGSFGEWTKVKDYSNQYRVVCAQIKASDPR